MSVTWSFKVDWDGDGSFDDGDEAAYLRGLITRRGREFYLQSNGEGFEPVDVGEITATLDNQSGRYNPYNSSSPLYPNIKPGRRLQIKVTLNESPFTVFTVFTGVISDIQPAGVDDRIVTISGLDDLAWLENRSLSDLLRQNYLVSDAVTDALTSAGWVAAGRSLSIEDNGDLIPWYWSRDLDVLGIIRAIENCFIGKAFIDQAGVFKFYSRHHVYSTVISLDQSELLKDLPVLQPWEVVRNIIEVYSYPRARSSNQVVWSLSSPMFISASQSITIYCNYSYGGDDCPATALVNPVMTTDYLVYTNSDGTGVNITSSVGVTLTAYATRAKIVIQNASSLAGWVTFLQVRGDPLTAVSYVLTVAQDTASQALYLPRNFKLDDPILQNPNLSIDIANFLKAWLANPILFPTIQIEGLDTKQYAVDLFDQIDLTISALGIDDVYLVSYIEHSWLTENGQSVLTKINLEPSIDITGYWTFSTNIGTTSYFGF